MEGLSVEDRLIPYSAVVKFHPANLATHTVSHDETMPCAFHGDLVIRAVYTEAKMAGLLPDRHILRSNAGLKTDGVAIFCSPKFINGILTCAATEQIDIVIDVALQLIITGPAVQYICKTTRVDNIILIRTNKRDLFY